MSISFPHSLPRDADGSHRTVSLVVNRFIDGVRSDLADLYAVQLMRRIAVGVALNFFI